MAEGGLGGHLAQGTVGDVCSCGWSRSSRGEVVGLSHGMTRALATEVRTCGKAARHFGAVAERHGRWLLAEVTATAFKEVMREAVGCDNRLDGGYIKLSLALPKDVADLVMVATAGAVAGLARHLENDVFGRLFGLGGRILL